MTAMTPTKPKVPEAGAAEALSPRWLRVMCDEFDEPFDRMPVARNGGKAGNGPGWKWGLDVRDEKDRIVVRAEAPGFTPEEIDVQVSDNCLFIKASPKEKKRGKEGAEEVVRKECYESILLPADVSKDKVDAAYKNGLLTVTLPKPEKAKARKVPVRSA